MTQSITLNARVVGDGPPVMILHGLFGSGRNWASISKQLGEQHQVWCVDLRNHGDSPHDQRMGYPEMADDLRGLMDREGFTSVPVIGHSMGGKTAMWFALTCPERVERLMVVDIAPVTYEHEYDGMIEAMQGIDLGGIKGRDEADAQLRASIPEAGIRQFLLTNLVSRDGRFRWRLNLEAITANLPAIVGFPELPAGTPPFTRPTLFLGGERSPYILPEHHARIRSLFPDAEIRHLAETGHWVHAERPREFLRVTRKFLA